MPEFTATVEISEELLKDADVERHVVARLAAEDARRVMFDAVKRWPQGSNPSGPHVEFSQEACFVRDGVMVNPFQHHSYVARVTWPDGYMVIVALPDGAARYPANEWRAAVLHRAAWLKKMQRTFDYLID